MTAAQVRDADAGLVVVDGGGRPRIHYALSKGDEASMVKVWVGVCVSVSVCARGGYGRDGVGTLGTARKPVAS